LLRSLNVLDLIEYRIAARLSEIHFYPFARDIYINIFRHFSHFPINLTDLSIKGDGKTITFMAYVTLVCMETPKEEFKEFYKKILEKIQVRVQPYFPYNIKVETFLGCLIYYYHPVEIRNTLASIHVGEWFDENEQYEFDLKKKTLLIDVI
jgi:hypothetical protein